SAMPRSAIPRSRRPLSGTRGCWRNMCVATRSTGLISSISGVSMASSRTAWRSRVCWGWLLAAAGTVAFGADSDFDKLMSVLAERRHGHVTFSEKKYIALLDRPVDSSGELLYDAPDRLEKRTIKPKPASLVLEGGVVTAQRGRHHYVLDLK